VAADGKKKNLYRQNHRCLKYFETILGCETLPGPYKCCTPKPTPNPTPKVLFLHLLLFCELIF
jgi:hypothetical protein